MLLLLSFCVAGSTFAQRGLIGVRAANQRPPRAQRRPRPPKPRVTGVEKVDRLIKKAMLQTNTKALFAVIIQGWRVGFARGYGDAGSGRPPGSESVFYIGSLSKALTGFGVMELVDKNKVSLSKPIGDYVDGLPRAWAKTPVLNYLTHTSGIPDIPKSDSFKAAVDEASDKTLQFAPGTSQDYNNFNFAIAGQLIEAVTKQSYLDYMKESVFTPAGMTNTGVGLTLGLVKVDKYPNIKAYGVPSGGLESTAGDLTRWYQYMLLGKGMSAASYEAMSKPLTPTKEKVNAPWHFTPGFQARYANGDEIIAKNGGVVGFSSMMQMIPTKGIGVIILEAHNGPGKQATKLWPLAANILHDLYGYPKTGAGEGDESP